MYGTVRLRPSSDGSYLETSAIHYTNQLSRFRATQKQPKKRTNAGFVQRFQVTRSLAIHRLSKKMVFKKTSRITGRLLIITRKRHTVFLQETVQRQ